jgi:circadian clock protein KaiB
VTIWPAEPRILLVDGDEDHRKVLAKALGDHGLLVEEAASAGQARACLAQSRYRLVMAHYGLPDETGADFLREARAAGLLAESAAIVFTGKPDVDDSGDFEIVRKPIDIHDLLRQVDSILGAPASPGPSEGAAPGDLAGRIALVLYVTMPWPSSARALHNIQEILKGLPRREVTLTVCDLAKEPERAETDRVVFSPTLVKVRPEPRMWVLGDLSDRQVVIDLLGTCGVSIPTASVR